MSTMPSSPFSHPSIDFYTNCFQSLTTTLFIQKFTMLDTHQLEARYHPQKVFLPNMEFWASFRQTVVQNSMDLSLKPTRRRWAFHSPAQSHLSLGFSELCSPSTRCLKLQQQYKDATGRIHQNVFSSVTGQPSHILTSFLTAKLLFNREPKTVLP